MDDTELTEVVAEGSDHATLRTANLRGRNIPMCEVHHVRNVSPTTSQPEIALERYRQEL
jgi:hypothetical protein